MPAIVNSSVLSTGITLADGTSVWPRATKKSRNARRSSSAVVSPAFEHFLAYGEMRELTEEELARAVRLDPSADRARAALAGLPDPTRYV